MNPPARPIDDFLFDACRAHGMRTRGQPATRVTLGYPDGSEATFPVPPRATPRDEPAQDAGEAWPTQDGWAFRAGEAAFNGTRFRIGGKLLAILRELAARPGQPVAADRLKRVVWGEEPHMVEDANLQGHVYQVRKRVRAALGLDEAFNPVPHADGAYRLAVY